MLSASRPAAARPRKSAGRLTSDVSTSDFTGLLELIYDGAGDAQPWLRSLSAIRSQFKATWAALLLRPATHDRESVLIAAGAPTALAEEAPQTFAEKVPPGGVFRELPAGRMMLVETAGVLGPLHVIGADLPVSPRVRARLRIARTAREGAFAGHHLQYGELLLPHLLRAIRDSDHHQTFEQEVRLMGTVIDNLGLGIAILGESGEVLKTNRCADLQLQSDKGIRLAGGRLHCERPLDERKLLNAIRMAQEHRFYPPKGGSGSVVSIRPRESSWLSVLVRPIPPGRFAGGPGAPAVALLIRSPDQEKDVPLKVIRDLFGLTPTEAAIALEIANGVTMDEAAEELNVMRNTIRTHMRSIFAKVGVRRQTALVRVILNSVATMV